MAIVFIILVLLTVFTYTPLAIYSEGWIMVFTFSVLIGLMLFTVIGYIVTLDYKWSLLKKAIWSLGLILLESFYLQCFYWLLHWGRVW